MKEQACPLCLKQCVRLHGAGDDVKGAIPSLSPSFLKKIGADNTEMLHIPSSFVKTHSKRLGTSLTLEGPSTEKWTVAVEGSFSKCAINLGLGWTNFVKDHHLQLADQLLFTLTGDSYFLVEVYDESGCQKLGALDAVNPLKPDVDSNGTTQEANETVLEFEAKPLEQEADKSCSKGSTPAARPAGQKRKEASEPVKESPSTKKALISLSSDDSERETPSSDVGKSEVTKQGERPRTAGKRGRPKKSQDFYQDVEEDDFSLFHKPRARNTPVRSAATGAEKKASSAAKKKPVQEEIPVVKPKSALMNEKVGHGFMRCQFVVDGSLEDPVPAVEAK